MIKVTDFPKHHDLHDRYRYFPSNKFVIGSKEEQSFFKSSKWKTHEHSLIVQQIYKDVSVLNKNVCPCQYIFVFSILCFKENTHWIHDEEIMTRKKFYNIYNMESKFLFSFSKRNTNSLFKNKQYINFIIESFSSKNFDISNDMLCYSKSLSTSKKRKAPNYNRKNNRKKFKNIMYENLKNEIDTLNDYIKTGDQKNDNNKEKEETLLSAYLKVEYYLRNKTLLHDINDYKRKSNNSNKIFKTALKEFIEKHSNLYLMKKVNPFFNRYYQNEDDDYFKMLRTNIKYGCKHEGGYSVQFLQTRANDEIESTVKICNSCNKII